MTIDSDKYRSTEEKEEWKKRCPIEAYKIKLIKNEVIDRALIQKIEEETLAQIELSFKFAKKSKQPDTNTVLDDVYKNPIRLGGN